MLEIIEAEADHFAGVRDRERVFQPLQRNAGGGRRSLGEIRERRKAGALLQDRAQVGRQIRVHRLKIDNLVAFDHTQPQAALTLESNDFHEHFPPCSCGGF
jgi:hypothetical protein